MWPCATVLPTFVCNLVSSQINCWGAYVLMVATLPEPSSLLSSQLLPHLKLKAGLDIAVRGRPQDGCLRQRTPDSQLYGL